MIDWQKDCKDAMWSMFMLNPNPRSEDIELDKRTMRENVARLVRLTTQKSGGLRGESNTINSRNLPLVEVNILIAATRLALAGYFGEMPEKVEDLA